MILSGSKKSHIERLKVKMGHGGTLDPMATGVLIVGVGKGTKCLQRFLECTKTYECVVLFGAATDSYDAVGKVVSKAPYEHVTKELVEEKLEQFRGKIMQKPSVFSALKVDGKKMYEYAREGKDIPEVPARPVEVLELDMVEWLEPGTHDFAWPKEEVGAEEREGAEKLLGIRKEDATRHFALAARKQRGRKRSRSPENDGAVSGDEQPKKPRTDSEPAMSGALPVEDAPEGIAQDGERPGGEAQIPTEEAPTDALEPPAPTEDQPAETVDKATQMELDTDQAPLTTTGTSSPQPLPPAARIRLTVTSGFYVRSFSHDLGLACSSLGLMSSLVRSRQGDYTLNQNVLEYSDLSAPSSSADPSDTPNAEPTTHAGDTPNPDPTPTALKLWEVQIQAQLEKFMAQEDWKAEEVDDEESWQARKKELMERRREEGRDESFKGGKKWGKGGKWGGKGKGNTYSRGMIGGRRD
ncbi:MAG: hypothetical protein I4N50_21130 [Rhizobium sp.]|nr:hypothetical protein [Rhizobium sp.]